MFQSKCSRKLNLKACGYFNNLDLRTDLPSSLGTGSSMLSLHPLAGEEALLGDLSGGWGPLCQGCGTSQQEASLTKGQGVKIRPEKALPCWAVADH